MIEGFSHFFFHVLWKMIFQHPKHLFITHNPTGDAIQCAFIVHTEASGEQCVQIIHTHYLTFPIHLHDLVLLGITSLSITQHTAQVTEILRCINGRITPIITIISQRTEHPLKILLLTQNQHLPTFALKVVHLYHIEEIHTQNDAILRLVTHHI